MKVSHVEAFDDLESAQSALGFYSTVWPDNDNRLIQGINQIQLRWSENGSKGNEVVGDSNGDEVYLVLSISS